MSNTHIETASAVAEPVPPKVLTLRNKLGYAAGDVGFNFLFDMGQLYLLIFFTDVMGLNAAVAGGVFLVAKLWDAFADMTVGTWVDNRKKIGKRGRYRAFIFWGAIPLAVMLLATFHNPGFSMTGNTIWAYLVYMIFGTAYSICNIPFGAMIPAMTNNPQERSVLASLRQAGGNLGLLIATVAFWPIVKSFENEQTGFYVAVSIFAIGGLFFIFFMYHSVEERYDYDVNSRVDETEKVPLLHQFGLLFKNRPLIGMSLASLFIFSAFNVRLAVQVYFAQYVLHDNSAVSYIGLFSIACVFPGVALVPYFTKRIGKRNTYILGCAIWFVADLFAFFFVKSTLSFVILSCFSYFGSAFPNSLNWAMNSDCVEYGEWKTGTRNQALTYSGFIWFRKVSQALAGFIPGVVLAAVGYVANQEIQTASTIAGIRALMFGYPLAMCILSILCIRFIYNLTDEKYLQITAELAERRRAKEAVHMANTGE